MSEQLVPTMPELEKQLDPRVESLAIPLARDYAEKNYPKLEGGTFQPAWRGANGEKQYKGKSPAEIAAEEGITEDEARAKVVDIANQPYNEYSDYWKEQNRGGADFLIKLLDERGDGVVSVLDLTDEATRAEYGDLIHENWISRNEWVNDPSYGDPDLARPYLELTPEEQQKDIDQLGVLQGWTAENPYFFNPIDRDQGQQPESVEENEAWKELYEILEHIHDSEFSKELIEGRQQDEAFHTEMYAALSIPAIEGESKTNHQQRESTALKEFFEQKTQSGEQLTEQQTANIIYELKNRGDFAGVVSVFETSKTDSPVIREFYAVALNKIGRLDESNAELESMRGEDGAKVGEISAILGKVYKLKSAELEKNGDISGAIDSMTISVSELERGFYDTYEFYPGINLVYNRLKLAELSDNPDMINTAFNDAELVMLAAKKAGADKTSDYWTAATLLESAVLTGELSDDHIQHLIETYANDWELSATIGNLESVAETIRTFQAKPDLDDATRDRFGKIFDSITRDGGVLPKLKSAQEGAYIKTEVEPRSADTLVEYGFMYGETTTMIGGNIQFGGQLQSHVVNRFDTGVAKVLISNLELDKVESLEDFNKIVDHMLRQQFRTDELEDLHAPTHEIYDDQIKKLLDVVGISGEIDKKMADSRTNVMVDLLLGRGDCRQHAHAKQLIFDTWKTNRLNGLFGNLREQQSSGSGTTETRTMIDELLRTQMMVFDSTIESTVKMNSLYDPAKNESGQYVVSEDFEPIEEHTWSGIVRFDSAGSVKSLEMADAFYQTEYGLGGKGQVVGNPEDYAGDGMIVTEIEAVARDGSVIKVPVRLKPAVYAGDRGKRAISHGDTGSAHLRGIDLGSDIPDVGRVIGSARIREFWEKIINPQLTKEAQT